MNAFLLSRRNRILNEIASQAFSIVVGALFFSAFFGGFGFLNWNNISFLQGDSSANYISQLFYLQDNWRFPLAANPTYGLEMSASTSLVGGPTLLLIIHKLLGVSIEKQLYGIFILISLILHHLFAKKILNQFNFSVISQNITALLFFLPFFLFRIEMHPLSAAVHWPLLWSILILVKSYKNGKLAKPEIFCLIVISYSIFINICFIVLLILLFLATQKIDKIQDIQAKLKEVISILSFLFLSVIFSAFIFDGFLFYGANQGVQSIKNSTSGGFGIYNFNLLSFINPDTGIRDDWYFRSDQGNIEGWSYNMSSLKISLGMTYGSYEGFAYLGLGFLFIASIALLLKGERLILLVKSCVSRTSLIWIFIIFLYAASGIRVSLGSFDFPPPGRGRFFWPFIDQWVPFRSSGRAIWIIAYGFLAFLLFFLSREIKSKALTAILTIGIMIQAADLSLPTYDRWKYASNKVSHDRWTTPPPSQLMNLSMNKRFLRIIPLENHTEGYQDLGYWSWRLGLQTNANYSARYDLKRAEEIQKKSIADICQGNIDDLTIYAIKREPQWLKQVVKCDLKRYKVVMLDNRIFLSRP